MGAVSNLKKSMKRGMVLRAALAIGCGILFFASLYSFIPVHALHGDEVYYIGRSMENIAFLTGQYSVNQVAFSSTNHPYTGELLMGLGLNILGQAFAPVTPKYVWTETLTQGQVDASRTVSLFVASLAILALVYLGTRLNPLAGLFGFMGAIAAPGFIDISVMAMLDIYVATFTLLALVSLYWYVKGSKKAAIVSGLFLGLAVGSKVSLDPYVAAFAVLLAIVLVEDSRARVAVRVGETFLTALAAFAVTSPVVILKFPQEVQSIVSQQTAGRSALSNLLVNQSINSSSGYGIFTQLQPELLVATIIVVALASAQVWRSWSAELLSGGTSVWARARSFLKGKPDVLYLTVLALFVSADFVATPLIFEYGRNFQRLSVYESLLSAVALAFFVNSTKSKPLKYGVIGSLFAGGLLVDYEFLGKLFAGISKGTLAWAYYIPTIPIFDYELRAFALAFSLLTVFLSLGAFGGTVYGGYLYSRSARGSLLRPSLGLAGGSSKRGPTQISASTEERLAPLSTAERSKVEELRDGVLSPAYLCFAFEKLLKEYGTSRGMKEEAGPDEIAPIFASNLEIDPRLTEQVVRTIARHEEGHSVGPVDAENIRRFLASSASNQ